MLTVLIVAVLLGIARPQAVFPEDPPMGGRDRMPKGEIGDDFLSFLVAAIDADRTFALDTDGLRQEFPGYARSGAPVFPLLREVGRQRASDSVRLAFSFSDDLHVPVPFSILWYHPIWIDTSRTVALHESRLPPRTLGAAGGRQMTIDPLYVYRLDSGHASIRVAQWLTALTFGLLSDFSFRAASVFKSGGSWYGLVAGTRPGDRSSFWLFTLKAMHVVVPAPEGMSQLASELMEGPY